LAPQFSHPKRLFKMFQYSRYGAGQNHVFVFYIFHSVQQSV